MRAPKFLRQILMATLQKPPNPAHRLGVTLVRRQPFDARPQAAMDVIFQARMRVVSRKIHPARRHLEMAMNEMHQPMRQIPRKIRAEIARPVLAQPPRHVHARIFFRRQFDIWISLIVPQQDVVARLPLLDQVVLKRQRLFFVIDLNEIDGPRFVISVPVFDSASRSTLK